MAQVRTGTVTVTNGSATVTGSGTTWLSDGIAAGNYFVVQVKTGLTGAGVVYEVSGVVSNTELTLTAPWGGDSDSGLAYVLHKDFIDGALPKLLPGDLETAPLFNKAIQIILNDKASLAALGTAAFANLTTSATDTTAGRVTRVGDGGLLTDARVVTNNLDTTLVCGIYGFDSGATGNPTSLSGSLIVFPRSTSSSAVRYLQMILTQDGLIRRRVNINGTWQSWSFDYTTGNVAASTQNLLANGSYGLGLDGDDVSRIADADAQTATAFVVTDGPTTANLPDANSGRLIHQTWDASNSFGVQIHNAVSLDKMHFRRKTTGVWAPWNELYHNRNILGTVSQSGGVPTGAIIERGSNANGEYVKFADGTLLMTGSFSVDLNTESFQSVTLPISYVTNSLRGPGFMLNNVSGTTDEYMHLVIARAVSNSFGFQLVYTDSTLSPIADTLTANYSIQARWY